MQLFAEPRFTFQDPILLVVLCIAGLLAVRIEFFILRAMGVRGASAGKRKVAGWLTVIILTCVPVSILTVISLGVIVFAVLESVAFLLVVGTRWGRRTVVAPRTRSRIRTLLGTVREPSPTTDLPWSITSWIKGLEAHGFSALGPVQQWEEVSVAVLVRPADGTIASIIVQPTRWLDYVPLPFVQLISLAQGRGGALSTSIGPGPEVLPRLIPQAVKFSSPGGLLHRHEEGRRLLEARGIRFEVVAVEEALDEMSSLWEQMLSALLQLPTDALIRLRPKLRRKPTLVASSLELPEIVERIDRIRVGGSGHDDLGARRA